MSDVLCPLHCDCGVRPCGVARSELSPSAQFRNRQLGYRNGRRRSNVVGASTAITLAAI